MQEATGAAVLMARVEFQKEAAAGDPRVFGPGEVQPEPPDARVPVLFAMEDVWASFLPRKAADESATACRVAALRQVSKPRHCQKPGLVPALRPPARQQASRAARVVHARREAQRVLHERVP